MSYQVMKIQRNLKCILVNKHLVNIGSLKRHSWKGYGWRFQPYDILEGAKTIKILKASVVSREEGWIGAVKDFQVSEIFCDTVTLWGFPRASVVKNLPTMQEFDLRAGKIPWRKAQQPTPTELGVHTPMDWGGWWATVYRQQRVGHGWSDWTHTHTGTVMLHDMHFSKLQHKEWTLVQTIDFSH